MEEVELWLEEGSLLTLVCVPVLWLEEDELLELELWLLEALLSEEPVLEEEAGSELEESLSDEMGVVVGSGMSTDEELLPLEQDAKSVGTSARIKALVKTFFMASS